MVWQVRNVNVVWICINAQDVGELVVRMVLVQIRF